MAFKSFADDVLKEVKNQIDENMTNVTKKYKELLKEKLDTPPARTGKTYGEHVASAPGEPPAPDTRELINSVDDVITIGEGKFYSKVYSDLPRSLWLELGTGERHTKGGRYTGKIEPRPAWVDTRDENKDLLGEIGTKGFKRRDI